MKTAWEPIEYDEIWNRFDAEFHFHPSTSPSFLRHGIKEPSPSETYSITHIWGNGEDNYVNHNKNLMKVTLEMFQSLTAQDGWIYALDWQHDTYKFYPHISFELDKFGEWPVPILPDGDYYIFLEKDFEWGIFGHPWEKTMCFWGKDVLEFLHQNKPSLLTKRVRKK